MNAQPVTQGVLKARLARGLSANPRQPFDTLRTSLGELRSYSRGFAEISGINFDFKKALSCNLMMLEFNFSVCYTMVIKQKAASLSLR